MIKSKQLFKSAHVASGAIFFFAILLWSGCGQNHLNLTASERKAFDSAPAEVKLTWERVLASDIAKDYANTQKGLESLRQMQLNDDQKQAVEKERAAFGQRLWAAAEKKEPAAVAVIRDIQNSRGRNATGSAR